MAHDHRDRDDWHTQAQDQSAQREATMHAADMRDLMMPSTYTPHTRVHGRLRPR